MKNERFLPALFATLILLSSCQSGAKFDANWPTWRGPLSTGVAPLSSPPVSWSETSNIKWKTAIPGKGYSTPIVWGDKVFITTSIRKEGAPDSTLVPYSFYVLALNRDSGEIIWETKVAEEEVLDRIHKTSSHASNSAVTDGKKLYAYFGSRGLFCMDFEGSILWERDFGQMSKRRNFGEGSSPTIFGNNIVVQWDHEEQSEIFCLDKNSGEEIWKKDRDETSTWSTPLIINYDGKVQVITTASNKVRSYDLNDGELIWECSGLTGNVTPNPIFNKGILFVMSGYRGYALYAISLAGASGDITDTEAILWSLDKNTPYIPSPLLINDRLYFIRSNVGGISCVNALSGEVNYENQKLEDMGIVYCSPVAAGGMIYQLGGTGLTYTIKEGSEFEILSQNKLDDSFSTSPAIVGDMIFLRGLNSLYCIAEHNN